MSTVPEAVGRPPAAPAAEQPVIPPRPAPGLRARISRAWPALRWPLGVYFATRLLYLVIAVIDTRLRGWQVGWEVSNWDGFWNLLLVNTGYPTHVTHNETTLGFLPLYPMLVYAIKQVLFISPVLAGMILSTVTGAITTVLVGRLSAEWWDEAVARRAVLFFCLFPGSIVFSMLYTEGLMLALVAGCLLALQHRRWLIAGVLAGLSTAVGPAAVAIIPACAVAALLELRARGIRDRRAWRALLAPVLAPVGLLAFGAFLWIWTGSPFASYTAQRYGWNEKTTPLALVHVFNKLLHQIEHVPNLHKPGINLNYPAGLLGAVFLAFGLWFLLRSRPRIPLPALAWTLGVAFLTVTSANVPPNPRMLIVAFPAVVVFAARLRGRAYTRLLVASTVLLVAMSLVTYVGTGLRP